MEVSGEEKQREGMRWRKREREGFIKDDRKESE